MSYLMSNQILSSLVLNSTTVLELTASDCKLFHTGIFHKANEFDLTDTFAQVLFSFRYCERFQFSTTSCFEFLKLTFGAKLGVN